MERANPDSEPETAEAFEALVAGQPHSSHAWIRYMAFLLTLGDAAAARAVAERALQTISFRQAAAAHPRCTLTRIRRRPALWFQLAP